MNSHHAVSPVLLRGAFVFDLQVWVETTSYGRVSLSLKLVNTVEVFVF